MEELSSKKIMTMLEAGLEKSRELGAAECIAIVDEGGNLRGFIKEKGGKIANIGLAINKAWTAIALKRPTDQVMDVVQPGAFAYGINISEPRILPVGGGLPITEDGINLLGGIGGSAGSVEQDIDICLAALDAGGFKTEFAKYTYEKK
jgi:corrinoid adenosyltransferase